MAQAALAALHQDRLADADELFRRLIVQEPQSARWPRMLVTVLAERNRPAEAAQLCRGILRQSPRDAGSHLVLADLERALGNREAAAAAYRGALAADATNGRALWSLAFYLQSADTKDVEEAARKSLETAAVHPKRRALLHFAIGETAHAARDHEAAFKHYKDGNALLRQGERFDPAQFIREISGATEDFDALDDRLPSDETPAPIFILGMPRSGSTLLEHMLGRHSQIEALGESRSFGRLAAIHLSRGDLSDEVLAKLGSDYIARSADRRHGDEPFFIDKMHLNWRFLPLILRAVPQARVIDLRRDFHDCCWSNFRFPFQGGHPASTDLGWLGEFMRQCGRILDKGRAVAPRRVLRLDYAQLVEEPERSLQDLCEGLGIAYEPACLRFGEDRTPIATASSEQVREGLNRDGLGSSSPYTRWLGALGKAA